MLKNASYFLEMICIRLLVVIFSVFSIETASKIGGAIGRTIGPLLGVTKVATRNLKLAMPELTDAKRNSIIVKMWDNLARTAVEFMALSKLKGEDYSKIVEIEGREYFDQIIANHKQGKASILFSGHFANWEILPKTASELGCPLVLVYRRANNPFVDKLIQKTRSSYQNEMIQKNNLGIKKIVEVIKAGKVLGMLMDQRVSGGIDIPFMGHDAKIAPAIAKIALKYNCPIFPTQVIRIENSAKFKVKVYPPLEIKKTKDEEADTKKILIDVNKYLEQFVRQHPHQWFWVHSRWGKQGQ